MNRTPKETALGYLWPLLLFALALVWLAYARPAHAADLGGNCCADLEERIAELEATTAHKGNRKVSVTVYGVVDEAVMHIDGDGLDSKWAVGRNSNVESFIGVAGSAVIMPRVSAGYVLEIGLGGGNTNSLLGAVGSPFGGSDNGTYTRRSFGYMKSEDLGTVSVGLNYQATHEISQISLANTQVAARMLSLRPLVGPQIGEALDLYDGGRTDLVKYDSPELAGFSLSGSWAPGGISGFVNTSDVWDVALRWHGEAKDFKAAAGIGYRSGIVIPTVGNIGAIGIGGTDLVDPKVVSGSVSIIHVPSGIFLNGAAGQLDLGGLIGKGTGKVTAWSVQGGIERHLIELGKTTFYGEYADANVDKFDVGLKYWGLGAVQHLDGAAMDLYASYRQYDLEGLNANLFMVGAKIAF
jgi:hypothetical protein